jgi:TPR repeat protein
MQRFSATRRISCVITGERHANLLLDTLYHGEAELKNRMTEKNIGLAVHDYQRLATHGDPDGANNFGFCLEHGRAVKQFCE